jgi:hypothetical protein
MAPFMVAAFECRCNYSHTYDAAVSGDIYRRRAATEQILPQYAAYPAYNSAKQEHLSRLQERLFFYFFAKELGFAIVTW